MMMRKPELRSKRPLPRRLRPSLLKRRRRDLRPLLPNSLMQLASMALPALKNLHQEVEEVAVEVAVEKEAAEVATEVVVEAKEVAVEVTEVAAERDVDLDLKARRVREDQDPKARRVKADHSVAEARDQKVLKVNSAQEPKVEEAKELKAKKVKADHSVAEARDPKVLRVSSAQELKVAEAEDHPELKVRELELKVRNRFSAQEKRELSVMVSTASKARRESSFIPSIEKTEPEEAEVSLRVELARATGELPMRKSSRLSQRSSKVRLPLRRRKRSPLPKRRLRLSSRRRKSLLKRISMLTNLP